MADIEDLPVELVNFVTGNLHRASDLAALARASHKFYDIVDPVLYKFAKDNFPNHATSHPLRWSAETGNTGTLKKALAAGIPVDMKLTRPSYPSTTVPSETFRTKPEAVGGKGVWDPPRLEPNQEWEPHEDDADDANMSTSSATDPFGTGYSSPRPALTMRVWDDEEDIDDLYDEMDGLYDEMDDFDEPEDEFMDQTFPGHIPVVSDMRMDDGMDEDEYAHGRRHPGNDNDPLGSFRALHLAARGGHDDVVCMLLDHGASIDVCSRQLCRCAYAQCRAATGVPSFPDRDLLGFSPLHLAVCHSRSSTAKLLLSRGASPRLSEPQRDSAPTVLHAAAATGQVDLCKYILDQGLVDVDAVDMFGLTPFYHAYRSRMWSSTVSFLLEKGADINFAVRQPRRYLVIESAEFFTTLYEACVYGFYSDAMKLISLGADVNKGLHAVDVRFDTPLHAACGPPKIFHHAASHTWASARKHEEQRLELIKLLLSSGADVEAKSRDLIGSPLHHAALYFDVSVLQILLAGGADVESQDSQGRTPLLRACGPEIALMNDAITSSHVVRPGEELATVKMLLDHGANINAKDRSGNTALHLACSPSYCRGDRRHNSNQWQEKTVRILLQRGARDNVANNLGTTPLEAAFRGGLLGICDILVRRQQSPQPWKPEDLERMILASICERPHNLDTVDFLLDLDVNGTLFSKSTYLMKMIDGGSVNMASRYLERATARPPLTPKDKVAILQKGLACDNETLIRQMLAMKVSVNFADKNGHTPLYVVLQSSLRGREDLVIALLGAGADMHFRPPSSTLMTPLEMSILHGQHSLVEIMLQHQPLRDNPKAPKGVYLHAAARTVPSKRMFSMLIRSGASVTELDSDGNTPLIVFLKSVADHPHWTAHTKGAASQICSTVWYLWNKKVDVNLRNKSGKAITSYLTAIQMYSGDNPALKHIADELKLCVEIVPAEGADGKKGLKALRFRHRLMELGNI